jgi:hypothetical protein
MSNFENVSGAQIIAFSSVGILGSLRSGSVGLILQTFC